MKTILVIGAGKSATVLLEDLQLACSHYGWHMSIADSSLELASSKIIAPESARALALNAANDEERYAMIEKHDLIISLLPPTLHIHVAKDCLRAGKHLLTASYTDDEVRKLADEVKAKGLLFLYEMGLDPGIDHMSAVQLIEQVKAEGGVIESFLSHCGGLIAPESDTNPWHYKISWNPRNIVRAGQAGATYCKNGQIIHKPYEEVFNEHPLIQIPGLPNLTWYPNRDSLSYRDLYQLPNVHTFIRTTLRYADFCIGWKYIVQLKLTDEQDSALVKQCISFSDWLGMKLKQADGDCNSVEHYFEIHAIEEERNLLKQQFEYLQLDSSRPLPVGSECSADILQFVLEEKLALSASDKDLILMMHELEVQYEGKRKSIRSLLKVKGSDQLHTAMAKTVGLPLSIAAQLILNGQILLRGLHIPVHQEIYIPVLQELEKKGISFEEHIEVI